jgi:hypothetical protein
MAIKVGGTNVITDARALNNITSADTATKNALAAAGVGGKTTLLTDTSISSGTNSVTVSFTGGYEYYKIFIKDVAHDGFDGGSHGGNVRFLSRFTNSSGSTISSSASYRSMARVISASNAGDNNSAEFMDFTALYQSWPKNIKLTAHLNVYNPYDTNEQTFVDGMIKAGLNNSGYDDTWVFSCRRNTYTAERNNSMIFFWDYPPYQGGRFDGGRITVYGVSL